MDLLPAHLNRDSFRDSFKGLVALEIISDLPFGFPINNIISLVQPRLLSGAGKTIQFFVKRQGCGSNSEVLIRPSNLDVLAQL